MCERCKNIRYPWYIWVILIGGLALYIFIGSFMSAEAALEISQPLESNFFTVSYVQQFTPTSTFNLQSISANLRNDNYEQTAGCYYYVKLMDATGSPLATSTTNILSENITGDFTKYYFDFTPYSVASGTQYRFQILYNDPPTCPSGGYVRQQYEDATSSYSGGSTSFSSFLGSEDLTFDIYSNSMVNSSTTISLEFIFPNTTTTLPDFDGYVVRLNSSSSLSNTYFLNITAASGTTIYEDSSVMTFTTETTGDIWVSKIPTHILVPNHGTSTWNLTADLYIFDTTEIIATATTSVVVSFDAPVPQQPNTPYKINFDSWTTINTTSTSLCPKPESILDVGGGLNFAFCEAIRFAFIPHDFSSNMFKRTTDKFKNTFPFSTYFGITRTISDAANSSTTSELNLNLTFVNWQDQEEILFALDSSTIPNALAVGEHSVSEVKTILDSLFDWIKMFIWVGLALALLKLIA